MEEKQNIENDKKEVIIESDGNFFTRWFRKTTAGREKATVYIMFSLMVLFTIIILVQRSTSNTKDAEFDIDKLYEQNTFNGVNDAIKEYESMEDAKSLFKEYEFLVKQDTLDTLRINQIEKILNEKLLNKKQ